MHAAVSSLTQYARKHYLKMGGKVYFDKHQFTSIEWVGYLTVVMILKASMEGTHFTRTDEAQIA
jgi:hypothetical protein